ncbi:MAG: CRISPR system precrRNA processing endoribonuclease RAMP protein Cas6 [Desulfoarculaceae bacterium]|nr:CRISPR system precrRNA processing endoribonuclease RAMP protein Cas6 [Desulfoarculaceae bacterium]
MQTGIYQFSCRFESEAVLPVFKGSTLRGGLGHALRRIACALRRQDCQGCLLGNTCAYAFLFEVKQNPQHDGAARLATAQRPHPYVLVPPDDSKRAYKAGDPFSFGIILFGPAIHYLPHLVYSVQEMGKAGLGKGNRDGDGRFQLETVHQNDNCVYDGRSLNSTILPTEVSLDPVPAIKTGTITLTCQTPLRLKHDNQLQDGLPFHLLIRTVLRRISTLESTYGGSGEPALDYRGLVARATGVAMTKSSCRWIDIERYSNRQRTAMLMGGITGTISYQADDLSEFIPLLRYCETVHLGKQTSFGLGRIRIETEASE